MSFSFGDINPQFKAQSAYKDGSGMGGGGMYFKQGKKRKDQPDDDLFQHSSEEEDIDDNDFTLDSEIPEDEIPQDSKFNKFVNWFRKKNN